MSKRKTTDDYEDIQLQAARARLGITKDLYETLTDASNKDAVVTLLSNLADLCSIDLPLAKKARGLCSKFSRTKWSEVAHQFNLDEDITTLSESVGLELLKLEVPNALLPPSFHARILPIAWRTLDVYRDTHFQRREAAKVRALEPVRNFIVLFSSYVIDERHNNI
jgi:hypothetical protein